MTSKLTFSGHESFVCKQFWLKKGYDFLNNQNKFNTDVAVVELGVGKNMVNSIRFWLKSFGLLDEDDNLNELADFLFSDKGKDPFIEDFGTVWLLHYYLIKTNKASIYNMTFNEFRKERFEFTRNQLHNFIKRKCEEFDFNYNENTINSDIKAFLKSYIKPTEGKVEIEDDFVGLLIDLGLVTHYKAKTLDHKDLIDWYKIDSDERSELPYQIVLHAILDNPSYGSSVTFKELQIGYNSPGMVFAINAEGLFNKIENITENYTQIIFTETAGNQILQFNSKPDKWAVLNDYYTI
jgi:hypothetical protein